MTDLNETFGSLFGRPDSDKPDSDKPNIESEAQIIPLAHERARIIVDQFDGGMLQGDVPAAAGVLVSRGILALTALLEADTIEAAALHVRCTRLEEERNDALRRARAAEAEQLPMGFYWCANFTAEARLANSGAICKANPQGGPLQMVGYIPDAVQTACLARIARLNLTRAAG